MNDERQWVLLCECHNIAELQVLRATLEARGVPCQVQGEHTYSVLGPIHGAVARARVLVPRGGLVQAREVAEDIVGPFDSATTRQDAESGSPYRSEASPPPPTNPVASSSHLKSHGVLVLGLFMLFPPLFGASHLYMGRRGRAGLLALTSVLHIASGLRPWLALVWIADVLGGAVAIQAHNQDVRALLDARAVEEEEAAEEEAVEEVQDEQVDDEQTDDEQAEGAVWRALRWLRTGSVTG